MRQAHCLTRHFATTSSHVKSSRNIAASHGSDAGKFFTVANFSGFVMRVKRTRRQSRRGTDLFP